MTAAALPLVPARRRGLPGQARPVLADLLPGALARDLVVVAAVAALTAVAAQVVIPVPGLPVPLTGQTFAVLLGAAALGPWRGAIAQAVYLAAGVVGLPVFAGATSGWESVAGASGGYLVGFVVAGTVVGALARRGADRRVLTTVCAYALGTLTVYAVGVPWLAVSTGMPVTAALLTGAVVFLPGDALKAALAAALLPTAWRLAR